MNIFKLKKDGTPLFIAEIGINHNGNLNTALNLVELAKTAKVDIVKFQIFSPEKLINPKHKKEIEFFKKYALTYNDFKKIKSECDKIKIGFLATPYDLDAVNFLDGLNVIGYKVASCDITNFLLLKKIAEKNKPILISTGAATIDEIKNCIKLINQYHNNEITLMHCVSLYPPKENELNLNAIKSLKKEFNLTVGYSDHFGAYEPIIAAYLLGAEVIEFHFTYDKKEKGADHKISFENKDVYNMIKSIQRINNYLGNGIKKPFQRECRIKSKMRRSIYAKEKIEKGEMITQNKIIPLRPVLGITSEKIDKILNKKAKKRIEQYEPIYSYDVN